MQTLRGALERRLSRRVLGREDHRPRRQFETLGRPFMTEPGDHPLPALALVIKTDD